MGAQCEVAAAKRAELVAPKCYQVVLTLKWPKAAPCFDTILKTYYSYFLRSHPSVRPGVSA